MALIRKLYKIILVTLMILCVSGALKPLWNRLWIEVVISDAAVFGTKHTVRDTRDLLPRKMREDGYKFEESALIIEKDENNCVSINITYTDEIKASQESDSSKD